MTGAAGQIAYSLLYSIAKGDVFGKDQVKAGFGLCNVPSHPIKGCCIIQHAVWLIPGISTIYVFDSQHLMRLLHRCRSKLYCDSYATNIHFPSLFQPIVLVLLDITPMLPVLEGVVMELQDCALPLLRGTLTQNGLSWGPVLYSLCASHAVLKACVFTAQMTRAPNNLIGCMYDPYLKRQWFPSEDGMGRLTVCDLEQNKQPDWMGETKICYWSDFLN